MIREWADTRSWLVDRFHVDEHWPGTTWASDRQGARALLEALEPGDAVVVATADRLGRSLEIVRDFSDRIEARQATLYIIDHCA